jgi:hypothetical protein
MMLGRMRMLPSDIDPTVRIGLVMTSQEIQDYSRAVSLQLQRAEPGSSEGNGEGEGEIPEMIAMQPTVRKSLELSRLREMEAREERVRASMDVRQEQNAESQVVNPSPDLTVNPSPEGSGFRQSNVALSDNNQTNSTQNTAKTLDIQSDQNLEPDSHSRSQNV